MTSPWLPDALLGLSVALLVGAAQLAGAAEKAAAPARAAYPAAPTSNQVDDYHGKKIADPYRPLENPDAPETRAWIEAENRLTEAWLEGVPERRAIRERLTKLWNYERWGAPFREGGFYFFTRNDGLQNQDVLYVLDRLDGTPRVLLDPNGLSQDGTVALTGWSVSRDGKKLAFGLASAGSDWNEWRVLDVASGKETGDLVKWVKFSGAAWTKDAAGFYYARLRRAEGRHRARGCRQEPEALLPPPRDAAVGGPARLRAPRRPRARLRPRRHRRREVPRRQHLERDGDPEPRLRPRPLGPGRAVREALRRLRRALPGDRQRRDRLLRFDRPERPARAGRDGRPRGLREGARDRPEGEARSKGRRAAVGRRRRGRAASREPDRRRVPEGRRERREGLLPRRDVREGDRPSGARHRRRLRRKADRHRDLLRLHVVHHPDDDLTGTTSPPGRARSSAGRRSTSTRRPSRRRGSSTRARTGRGSRCSSSTGRG